MTTRRDFLTTTAAGAALGLGELAFRPGLPPVSAADVKLDPSLVRLDSGIEALVRLLEETPGHKLLEEIGSRIKKGLSYREVLTALFLAGVRGVRPHSQGNFHSVLMVHSAHQASVAAPDGDRWLPIFWALDAFKHAQADSQKNPWRLEPVNEAQVPPARKARQAFLDALAKGDAAAADAAAVALARGAGGGEAFDAFALFGSRALAYWIGHPAIYVSNGWRALQTIGWQHAEPVLRSLAYLLVNAKLPPAPDHLTDADTLLWRSNRELAARLPEGWQEGKPGPGATTELLAVMRQASPADTAKEVVELLKGGAAPRAVWDAAFFGAAELMLRKPARAGNWIAGIVPLHAATTLNALHFAYTASSQDEMRRFLLLQAAAVVPVFRDNLKRRDGRVAESRLDQLEPAELKDPAEIFADVSRDRALAVRKALTYLKGADASRELVGTARRLAFLKGTDAHDYKFSSAVFEDYEHVSPAWRDRYLAAALFILRGSAEKDIELVERARAALKS